jgi:peptidoglycan/xylan/chitin deacetylase (PgdA/CDA1 family)
MNPVSPQFRRGFTLLTSGVLGFEAFRRGFLAGSLSESFPASFPFGFAASAAFLLPTLARNCTWLGPVIRRFETSEREVWITIDDGPDPNNTPEILEVLADHNATATFFTIGKRVLQRPDLAAAVIQAGHRLQNHTFSHPAGSFWAAGPRRVRSEIEKGLQSIHSVTGTTPTQFRAPAGLSNPFVHARISQLGLQMVGWSVAGLDGIPHCPDRVVERVMSGIRPGAILLLHEGPVFGMKPGTRARTLSKILAGIRSLGYRTVIPSVSMGGLGESNL